VEDNTFEQVPGVVVRTEQRSKVASFTEARQEEDLRERAREVEALFTGVSNNEADREAVPIMLPADGAEAVTLDAAPPRPDSDGVPPTISNGRVRVSQARAMLEVAPTLRITSPIADPGVLLRRTCGCLVRSWRCERGSTETVRGHFVSRCLRYKALGRQRRLS
jgi:hypothetical protein